MKEDSSFIRRGGVGWALYLSSFFSGFISSSSFCFCFFFHSPRPCFVFFSFSGFLLGEDGKSCIDIDECEVYSSLILSAEKEKANLLSSPSSPYSGSRSSREDAERAMTRNAQEEREQEISPSFLCEHLCENLPGAFQCHCYPGYKRDPHNPRRCIDRDECVEGLADESEEEEEERVNERENSGERLRRGGGGRRGRSACAEDGSEVCTNTPGSYVCSCAAGYRLERTPRSSSSSSLSTMMKLLSAKEERDREEMKKQKSSMEDREESVEKMMKNDHQHHQRGWESGGQQVAVDSYLATAMARRESTAFADRGRRAFLFSSDEEGIVDGFEWRPSLESRDTSLPPSVYTYLSKKQQLHRTEKETKEDKKTVEMRGGGGGALQEDEETTKKNERQRRQPSLDEDPSSMEKEKSGETGEREEEEGVAKILKNKTPASYRHTIAMERRLQSQQHGGGWSQALDTLATLASVSSSSSSSKPYRSSSSPPSRSPGSVTSPGDTALAVADLAMQLAQVYGNANKALNTINALSTSSSLPSPSIGPSSAASIASYLSPATSAASGLATVVQALSSSSSPSSSSPQLTDSQAGGGGGQRNNSILKTLAQHADPSSSGAANPFLLRSSALQRTGLGRRGFFFDEERGDMNRSVEREGIERDINPQEVWSDEMYSIMANLERLRNQPWRDPASKPFERNPDETCVDINECQEFEQAGIRPCKIDELTCVNTPGTLSAYGVYRQRDKKKKQDAPCMQTRQSSWRSSAGKGEVENKEKKERDTNTQK